MNKQMDGLEDGWKNGQMKGRMDRLRDGWMNWKIGGWMGGRTDE